MKLIMWLQDWYCLIRYPLREKVNVRYIIDKWNLDLRQLTDNELRQLIKSQEVRLAALIEENALLVQESIRRSDLPDWRHTPEPPTLF